MPIKIRFSISLVMLLLYTGAFAQVSPGADTAGIKTGTLPATRQVDMADVFKKVLHLHSKAKTGDEGHNLHFSIFPAIGYTLQTRLAAILAGNVAFKNGSEQDSLVKVSTVTASIAFTQNNQVVVPVQSNIWSKGGNYNFVGDWRISKYPQDTYGLGGNSKIDSADLIDYSYFRIYQTMLRRVSGDFYVGVGYNLDYHWGIKEAGYEDGSKSDFDEYGPAKKTVSSGISLDLLYDGRDDPIYPTAGAYANIIYRNNYKFLGSDNNWQSLLVDARKYFHFPARSNNVLAFWTYDWLVLSGTPPYLDLPSTAWDTYTNTGRGYIQGRFRSRQMLYLESEYRYGITRNGLLGGVVFVNAQSFAEWPGNYTFKYVQPAAGLGLRVKLNKVSKTNIDIDYGFGLHGSRGLFINIAEAF